MTRRHRRHVPLFLLLFLVFWGQNAGLVHVIGHGYRHEPVRLAAPAVVSVDGALPGAGRLRAGLPGAPDPADDGAVCEKCFTFAQVAAAAAPHLPSLLVDVDVASAARPASTDLLASAPPPSRSRGPPAVLL